MAVGVALAFVIYSASTAPRRNTAAWPPHPPAPGAPVSTNRPALSFAGRFGDEVAIDPQSNEWTSPGNLAFSIRYFWLRCDLRGRNCVPISNVVGRTVVPPQALRLYTIRGAVTVTNARGSTTVDSRDFYWVHAGIPLDRRGLAQYDPDQLRAWYGLRPSQNGVGETILVADVGRAEHLRAAVDHFSAHYRLPHACGHGAARPCFTLELDRAPGSSARVDGAAEVALDVEWAHAVAPRARIVVVEGNGIAEIMDEASELVLSDVGDVISSSWGGTRRDVEETYAAITHTCHLAHVVCTFAAGDSGTTGTIPANSPYVLAAGGTMFKTRRDGEAKAEAQWPYGGFGETAFHLPRPSWQAKVECSRVSSAFSCASRAIPDVSATAAGAPTFEPTKYGFGWFVEGGTSLSSPLWAALVALADQELRAHGKQPIGVDELHQVLYRGYAAAGLDDIPPRGWDWATGWGAPRSGIVDVLTRAIERYRAGG